MENRFEFFIPSSDGQFRLHGVQWVSEGKAKAVLQISHGMTEHIMRYDEFARAMNRRGIAVLGHDHLGHGRTAPEQMRGCFSEEDGAAHLLSDLHIVTSYGKRQYPGLPFFLLGHSMGSFLGRRYLASHGEELSGALFLGTGYEPGLVLTAAEHAIARSIRENGRSYHDRRLNHLMLGRMNRRFEPGKTSHDWLSRDEDKVAQFEGDPLCRFDFSAGACADFVQIMRELQQKKDFNKIPRTLPVCFLSGAEDPVGSRGRGVKKVSGIYQKGGFTDVSVKLYPGARHELVNETNREEVYEDIATWVERHL